MNSLTQANKRTGRALIASEPFHQVRSTYNLAPCVNSVQRQSCRRIGDNLTLLAALYYLKVSSKDIKARQSTTLVLALDATSTSQFQQIGHIPTRVSSHVQYKILYKINYDLNQRVLCPLYDFPKRPLTYCVGFVFLCLSLSAELFRVIANFLPTLAHISIPCDIENFEFKFGCMATFVSYRQGFSSRLEVLQRQGTD